MTKAEREAKLEAFIANEDNFVFVSYNDPRAIAQRNAAAKRYARQSDGRAASESKGLQIASSFQIGQTVRAPRGVIGRVEAINGLNVSIDVCGVIRTFSASFLRAV